MISQKAANYGGLGVLLLAAIIIGIAVAMVIAGSSQSQKPLLSLPYMTWFVLHLVIAGLGILTVAGLALAGVLGDTGTSALLGSLFGYVLGAAGTHVASPTTQAPTVSPSVDKVFPPDGPEGGGIAVVLSGTSLPSDAANLKVTFDKTDAAGVSVVNANSLYVTTPAHAPGKVPVVVSDAKDNVLSKKDLSFEYKQQ